MVGPVPLPASGLSNGNVACTVSKAVPQKIIMMIIIIVIIIMMMMVKLDHPGKITLIRNLPPTCLRDKG